MRHAEPPLSPSGQEARSALRRELAKAEYADRRNLVQRLWDWLQDRLNDLVAGAGGVLPVQVLVPLLLVLVLGVVIALSRLRRRHGTQARSDPTGVLHQVDLSAAQLRARAVQHQDRGEHAAAAVDAFRAIARGAEERALLLPRPGRTAHEVSVELTDFFPTAQQQLAQAAGIFDVVRYGAGTCSGPQVEQILALEDRLRSTQPRHATTVAP